MTQEGKLIGRVTRCSTRGFVGAVRLPEPELPVFGAFCEAEAQHGQTQVLGLIYDLSVEDDELARQLAATEGVSPERIADSQANRQVPVEYSAVAVGYRSGGAYTYALPPQPPLTLAPIRSTPPDQVRAFTDRLDFLPLLVASPQLPIDDLLLAALRTAASVRPEHERRPYLVRAAAECARLIGRDLTRLDTLLRALRT